MKIISFGFVVLLVLWLGEMHGTVAVKKKTSLPESLTRTLRNPDGVDYLLNLTEPIQDIRGRPTSNFDAGLIIRRRLERGLGPTTPEALTEENVGAMESAHGRFFYVYVDSGNLGSKLNAYKYATRYGIRFTAKLYVGPLETLAVPEELTSFVIKPANLSSSRGVRIFNERRDVTGGRQFTTNEEIVEYYRRSLGGDVPKNIQFMVEEFIYGDPRPTQLNFYSFNGYTPWVLIREWPTGTSSVMSYYDPATWTKFKYGQSKTVLRKPGNLRSTLRRVNQMTAKLGTYLRVDFLIDGKDHMLRMVETSTYPFCASHYKSITAEMDVLAREAWLNSWPFNDPNFEDLYRRALEYWKIEPCRTGYGKHKAREWERPRGGGRGDSGSLSSLLSFILG
mmetsp:Transcript_35280/g.99458  ORF Transcript_35280/g.99458 Transcript_35280/m.99458 type:complete len:393 (+) Transcript_35280:185-1363(+)